MTLDLDAELTKIQGSLYSYIFSLIPHKQDAEDILQQSNLVIYKNIETFDPQKGKFISWAFTIARYQVLAYRTKKGRNRIHFSNELTESLACDYQADSEIEFNLKQQALNSCLSKLPDHMKSIALLRFKRDFSLKEISKSLNRPIGSVSATLFRIRDNIKKCFDTEFESIEKKYFKSIN